MILHTAFPNQGWNVCIEKDKVRWTMPKLQVTALIIIYDVEQDVEEAVPISQHHFALASKWSQKVIWIIRTRGTALRSKFLVWGVKNSGKYNMLKVTGCVLWYFVQVTFTTKCLFYFRGRFRQQQASPKQIVMALQKLSPLRFIKLCSSHQINQSTLLLWLETFTQSCLLHH